MAMAMARCVIWLCALVAAVSSQVPQRLPYSFGPQQEARSVQPRAFPVGFVPNTIPIGFRATSPTPAGAGQTVTAAGILEGRESFEEDSSPSPTLQVRRPSQPSDRDAYFNSGPVRSQGPPQNQAKNVQLQYIQNPKSQQALRQEEEDLLEEIEEKEEPDRLTVLLQQSKFNCAGLTTGYYADEGLGCEVFHYCQANTKHSWICPEGFTFHQVHLICMPQSGENICQKSSSYHFINEYLYKPINAEEVERKPNVTLRYSDRYYPAEVYHDERYDLDDEEEQIAPPQRASQAPVRQQIQYRVPSPSPQPHSVFRSPEEVNIPLVQRRPVTTPSPSTPYRQVTQQQQQQQQITNENLDFEYE